MNLNDDFIDVYARIRSEVLCKSLTNLKSYLKTSSFGITSSFAGINVSPLLGGRRNLHLNRSDGMTFIKGHGSGLNTVEKSSGGAKFSKMITDAGMGLLGSATRQNNLASSLTSSESKFDLTDIELTEKDVVSYVTIVTGLYKLMQFEQKLLEEVIAPEHHKIIFSRLVKDALDFFFQEGDSLAQRVKKALQAHKFNSSLCLFPVLRYHAEMRNHFDLLLDGCEQSVISKMLQLGVILQTQISKSLDEFFDSIKQNDSVIAAPDGTVHQLTADVMSFIVNLNPYLTILGRVLTISDMRSMEPSADKNRTAFSQYIFKILGALSLSLNKKADFFSNNSVLRSLFFLNNNYYILKTLSQNQLIPIVRLYQHDQVESNYHQLINRDKAGYRKCWEKILDLLEMKSPMSQQKLAGSPYYSGTLPGSASAHSLSSPSSGFKLKESDRKEIKNKFSGFNKEFEALSKEQKKYTVPDPDLRKDLIEDNINIVLSKYKPFYDQYSQVDFSRIIHKYIKYSPDHVIQEIKQFFSSAA